MGKEFLKGSLIFIAIILLFLAIGQGVGWFNVFSTRTLGKAQQNAQTEVYYETQSFVTAKKQAALKYYKEYQKADSTEKEVLKQLISNEFSDFDENKLDNKLQQFIYNCKYN